MKGKVVKKGNFKKDYFKRFIPIFKKQAIMKLNDMSRQFANDLVTLAKRTLDDQTYNWKPLSEIYRQRKIKEGLSEKILIATGFYRDHIQSWVWKGNVYFGVRKTTIHEPSGLPLWLISKIHEFGTKKIPSRPLWRPILAQFIKQVPKYQKLYYEAVKRGMQKV